MSARQLKVKSVPRESYKVYHTRAIQLYETMQHTVTTRRWSALGVNAVHCAISLNDALTVFNLGQRSAGEDHHQAAELLFRLSLEGAATQAKNFGRIIAKKTAVEYEERDFRENEALELVKQVERFFAWGTGKLPKTG